MTVTYRKTARYVFCIKNRFALKKISLLLEYIFKFAHF